jgi:hypothetical protein
MHINVAMVCVFTIVSSLASYAAAKEEQHIEDAAAATTVIQRYAAIFVVPQINGICVL